MSTTPFGTQVIGQTEKALNAILDRELDGTGLTEPQWVTLTLTVMSGGAVDQGELLARTADALRVAPAAAQERIAELAAAGLVAVADDDGAQVRLTDAGRELQTRIRNAVTEITQRLWGDLPAEELAVTGHVLSTILARANQELG